MVNKPEASVMWLRAEGGRSWSLHRGRRQGVAVWCMEQAEPQHVWPNPIQEEVLKSSSRLPKTGPEQTSLDKISPLN